MQTIDKTKVDEIIYGLLENNDLTASPEVWYGLHQIKTIQPVATDINVGDTISRQAAIDAVDSETVSTNPEHFKSSEKFIKFMDDADISSFGIWQWSNGFNTALVATTIQLKKLPSAQPEQTEMIKEIRKWINSANRGNADYFIVDKIEEIINRYE